MFSRKVSKIMIFVKNNAFGKFLRQNLYVFTKSIKNYGFSPKLRFGQIPNPPKGLDNENPVSGDLKRKIETLAGGRHRRQCDDRRLRRRHRRRHLPKR